MSNASTQESTDMNIPSMIVMRSSDGELLNLVRRVLTEEGHAFVQVTECHDFIKEISRAEPVLGIVDIDGGGRDCIARIRESRRIRPGLPLVVISSDPSIPLGRKIHGLKIFSYLLKPLQKTELLQVVGAALGEEDPVPWRFRTRIRDFQWYRDNIPCMGVCPVHTDSGRYVQLIAERKFREAYLVARSPNPLASTCGRVCAAFCEDACRRSKIDCAVTIRALKRFVTEQYGPESGNPETFQDLFARPDPGSRYPWHLPSLKGLSAGRGKRVAVIGSGPAGLACAHDLAVMGFKVTIYEASDRCGGAMQMFIPEYRLPRSILNREIETVLSRGVELKLNTPISGAFGIQALRETGFEAIFLATGAMRGRALRLPGWDLSGVYNAIDFLIQVRKKTPINLGKKVIILGGGKVALDIARTAWRLITDESMFEEPDWAVMDVARIALQASVKPLIIYPESVDEMAAAQTIQGRDEIRELRKEGIEMLDHRLPKRFLGKDGHVCAVVFDRVSRCIADDGTFAPQIVPDSEETLEADSVIMAVGQMPDTSYLVPEDGMEITSQGFVRVNPRTLCTTVPGVFAGGDVAFGSRSIIEAVNNGKTAALAIAEHLTGLSFEAQAHVDFEEIPVRTYHMAMGYEKIERKPAPTLPLEQRVGNEEIEAPYPLEQALEQAQRCLKCHIETIFDASKCILCGRCVDICPYRCLKIVSLRDVDVEGEDEEALAKRLGYQGKDPLSAMIKDDEKCIRCGLCALRCPTGAMSMERFSFVERYGKAGGEG